LIEPDRSTAGRKGIERRAPSLQSGKSVANGAGLSSHQLKQAIRVANLFVGSWYVATVRRFEVARRPAPYRRVAILQFVDFREDLLNGLRPLQTPFRSLVAYSSDGDADDGFGATAFLRSGFFARYLS
jgi:hypothetical protein